MDDHLKGSGIFDATNYYGLGLLFGMEMKILITILIAGKENEKYK